MPRASEPRVMVRFSDSDLAVVEAAAESCGVATGALIRECAVRAAASVARDVSEGRLRLRRRSSAVPVPSAAVSSAGRAEALLDPGSRALLFRAATQR